MHTVCVVGFRSPALPSVPDGEVAVADGNIEVLYIHDDNLGPNARFEVSHDESVSLIPSSPPPRFGDWPVDNPTASYHELQPTELAVAVHMELRTDPLALQRSALGYSQWLAASLGNEGDQQRTRGNTGMLVSSRFIRLHDYVDRELTLALQDLEPPVLSRARLALWEEVAPMSYHVGWVRVSLEKEPMMDILFDTSDSDRHLRPKACVMFHSHVPWLLKRWKQVMEEDLDLGTLIRAW